MKNMITEDSGFSTTSFSIDLHDKRYTCIIVKLNNSTITASAVAVLFKHHPVKYPAKPTRASTWLYVGFIDVPALRILS